MYHHYDRDGVYTASTALDLDVRDGSHMPPPFGATLQEPPTLSANQTAVFAGGAWTVVADWRGFTYWLPDGTKTVVEQVGTVPPTGALTIEPVLPTPDAVVVTARQARLALLSAGKLTLVNATINSLPSPQREAAQIEWEFASEIRKDSPMITLLAPLVGLSPSNVTTLFNTAATL